MDQRHFSLRPVVAAIAAAAFTVSHTTAGAQGNHGGDSAQYRQTQPSPAARNEPSGNMDGIRPERTGDFIDLDLVDALRRRVGIATDFVDGRSEVIAVRGIDPAFNSVTFNGRVLPFAGGQAFDLNLLAPDYLSGIEIYKTGRADFATGNVGAAINLVTPRPLDSQGLNWRFATELTKDTTHPLGDKLTPDVSGGLSWSNEERSWGMVLSANHQRLTGATVGADVNQWDSRRWIALGQEGAMNVDPMGVNHDPQIGQLYSIPGDVGYIRSSTEHVRNSTLFSLQHRSNERAVATLDYVFSENEMQERLAEQRMFFTRKADFMTFDTDRPVATAVFYTEKLNDLNNIDFSQEYRNQKNTLSSLGLNFTYDINQRFSVAVDLQDSTAKNRPNGPMNTGSVRHTIGAPVVRELGAEFRTDVPGMYIAVDDSAHPNPNGLLDSKDLVLREVNMVNLESKAHVQQNQLEGTLKLDKTEIQFGVESRRKRNRSSYTSRRYIPGSSAGPGDIPEAFISPVDFSTEFNDYDMERTWPTGFVINPVRLAHEVQAGHGVGMQETHPSDADLLVEEDVSAIFSQLDLPGRFLGKETRLSAGLRYEHGKISTTETVHTPGSTLWAGSNGSRSSIRNSAPKEKTSSDYDHILPNVDFAIHLTTALQGHFSYSKTIALAPYPHLEKSIPSATAPSQLVTLATTTTTASLGGTQRRPLESKNLDLALVWQFNNTDYVSIGYFEKQLDKMMNPLAQPSATPSFNYVNPVVDGWEMSVQQRFGHTGFGVQANYAAVNSDAPFDNTDHETQFALPGVGDTANLILTYENHGFHTRLAYNWRDTYLHAIDRVQNEPIYYTKHARIDLNIRYAILQGLEVSIDGLNLTGENIRSFGRSPRQIWNLWEQGRRYQVGLRYYY